MAYFRMGKTDDVTNTAGPTSSHGYMMVQARLEILCLAIIGTSAGNLLIYLTAAVPRPRRKASDHFQ